MTINLGGKMVIGNPITPFLLLALILLSGCTQPIYNVFDVPVITLTGSSVKMDDVERAIVQAGTALGWSMRPIKPGLVVGRLALRTHVAIVDVTYDTKTYNITYKDSINLDYDGTKIHKNYNGWITNLDREIRNQLLVH